MSLHCLEHYKLFLKVIFEDDISFIFYGMSSVEDTGT